MLCILQSVLFALQAQNTQRNIAYTDDNVRFTVISDGALRLEYAPDGKFVDDRSHMAINRLYPQVDYKLKTRGGWVEITTSKMKMRYKKNSGQFTDKNLIITAAKEMLPFSWKPGMQQKGNLKGTYRTLDGMDGDTQTQTWVADTKKGEKLKLEDGLLATDGWTFIDDSQGLLFDNDKDWDWVKERPANGGQDWYFMAYGHDYKAALKDYTLFAGKVPLPPRYAFGYWWSRYWLYSDKEFRNLIDNFHTYQIPLDVLVVDMDWHYTDPGFGGWTGWTWNRRLFPDPAKFLGYLKSNDLKITLNLHPADGVAPYEEKYPEMAQWMGVDTAKQERIPWVVSDKRFINGMFNKVLRPMEKQGVDFWWLDWQQWMYDKKVDSLSNTWWINYVFFSDMKRKRDTRTMLYHRWGGLGNHRYQIGFSGDAVISWKSLEFQPYFTNCASNVLYGYWSHDIGGHMFKGGDKEILDPELFTRWMQYGALTPVMRTHSTKNSVLNKELWNFKGDYFEALRNSILFRYQLAPYIYTMARETYDNGISICRPMYYDYPEAKEAYDFKSEYMFGDQILVAPITTPMQNRLSTVKVWLPEGNDWFEWTTGTLLKGGQIIERSFTLTEYPVYVKAGSVLPLYNRVKNLNSNSEEIIVNIFPGDNGSFTFYEDNGNDKYYANEYARTRMYTERKENHLTVTVGPRQGKYRNMPTDRQFKIKVLGSAIPETITINGNKAEYEYIGDELALLITIPQTACNQEKTIEIQYPTSIPELNDGIVSQFKRFSKAITALKYRDAGIVLTPAMGATEATSIALTYSPERFNELIETFKRNYSQMPEMLKEQKLNEANSQWFMKAIGWKK